MLRGKDAQSASYYIHRIKKKVKSEIGSEEDPGARARYEFDRLKNPFTGDIPENIRAKELSFAAKLPRNTALLQYKNVNPAARQLIADWDQRGPYNVGGRTRALAIDVADENVILAGGVSGGMWRSTDNGVSWEKTTEPSMLHSVSALAQDTRPGKTNIWYHGSGELEGNSAAAPSANYRGNGIYKSTNNGISWQILPSTQTTDVTTFNNVFQWSWRLVTNPANVNQDEVYVATIGGIQRSVNGGTTWTNALGTNSAVQSNNYSRYTDIAISSQGVRYATMSEITTSGSGSSPQKGIFRSTEGTNWINITPAKFPEGFERIVLAIAPSNENIVYFLAHTPNFGKFDASIWKYTYISGDGSGAGGTWEDRSANVPDFSKDIGDYNAQDNYNMLIQVKPDNPNIVFIGGTNLYVSRNGFATGNQTRWIGGYLENVDWYPNHHPDQHALVFYPSNPNRILSGHDGGLSRANNINTSDSIRYEDLNRGYITTQCYSIAINLNEQENDILGGFQDNGSWVTQNNSATTNWSNLFFGDGATTAITKNSWIVSAQEGFIVRYAFSNTNEFLGYAQLNPAGVEGYEFINPYLIDPNNQFVMYLPKGDTLYRNSDISAIPLSKGDLNEETPNWRIISTVDPSLSRRITAVAVSKTPADIVYFGTDNGKLFKLTNPGGATPARTTITGTNFPPGYISCIAVNPADANEVIVTFSNYGVLSLFQTKDGGTTWVAVAGNLEQRPDGTGNGPSTRWVSILPSTTGGQTKYFVGTSTGLYATANLQGEQTIWLKEGQTTIGDVPVDMVLSRSVDNLVAVGTHGNGVYTVNYNVDIESPAATDQIAVKAYPSPFTVNKPITIEYTIPRQSRVIIKIYDVAGRLITTLLDESKQPGNNTVQWNGRSSTGAQVHRGMYLYTVATANDMESGKVLFLGD
ncbi:WD40/YVTN/BNR-like repeat-containing protein [Adhaeribacter radiodurans]|uniref:T9SS type A sorting domain-containing protein n=1 Tax=Adhaeribacter radiodurans TaxID=2745197 RepID=A0A7L7L393_9BACT|nr:FlgD immunoglobulin-like domain containing protein [Adhaeribacter radiodurans]QMU27035.1 T9SS type A sorting domain-containing protein [Adhaeribacter radiodurans]